MSTNNTWPATATEMHRFADVNNREWTSRRLALQARQPFEATIPAKIANINTLQISNETQTIAEDAVLELTRFDSEIVSFTAPFTSILLRSESAASSEIEMLTSSAKQIVLAELGRKSAPNSMAIVGNVRAMQSAITLADTLNEESIIEMQSALLGAESPALTGKWRDQPVWIGSRLPHTAVFVGPKETRIAEFMADLVKFANRTDLLSIAQIAVTHAQFETIHPFPDGNGRTGRAIIQSMLRRMGITNSITVPVSAGLLNNTQSYFDALTQYRAGDPEPIIVALAEASLEAVKNGRELVDDITKATTRWDSATTARSDSAARRMLAFLPQQPVVNAKIAADHLNISERNAQNGIDTLVNDGVLHLIGGATRNRLFEAREILTALDNFAERARRNKPIHSHNR